MNQTLLYSVTGIGLFGIGFYGLISAAPILRKILSLNVMGIGVFMLLVAMANRGNGISDSLPHAMVLTGIVVAVAGTALALALLSQINALDQAQHGRDQHPDRQQTSHQTEQAPHKDRQPCA